MYPVNSRNDWGSMPLTTAPVKIADPLPNWGPTLPSLSIPYLPLPFPSPTFPFSSTPHSLPPLRGKPLKYS